MNKCKNIIWGIILIVLSLIIMVNVLGIADINIFFSGWWTLFIIIPSFIDLFSDSNKTGSIIGLIIGVALLLACQGLFDFSLLLKLIIPLIIFICGLSLILKNVFVKSPKISKDDLDGLPSHCATFGDEKVSFAGQSFKGATLNAIFGGVKLDLTEAKIKDDAVITVSSIFGGIDILLPDDVNIISNVTPIFGGFSDTRKKRGSEKGKTIYIKGSAVFGGVEVK